MDNLLQIINERILVYGGIEATATLIEQEMADVYFEQVQQEQKFIRTGTQYEGVKKREFLKIINA